VGEAGRVGLIVVDRIGRETVMQRAVSHGHFAGPDFVHPEAGRGDLIESKISGDQKNDGKDGQMGARGNVGGLSHHQSSVCMIAGPIIFM